MFELIIATCAVIVIICIAVICILIWSIKYLKDNTINNKDIEQGIEAYKKASNSKDETPGNHIIRSTI
jgi:hypothetical protein